MGNAGDAVEHDPIALNPQAIDRQFGAVQIKVLQIQQRIDVGQQLFGQL